MNPGVSPGKGVKDPGGNKTQVKLQAKIPWRQSKMLQAHSYLEGIMAMCQDDKHY